MFNLLMSGLTTAFEVSPWELEKARFGEYTDPVLLSQFEKLDEPPVKALLSLPATSRWTSPIIAICSISTTVRASNVSKPTSRRVSNPSSRPAAS